MDYKTTSVLLGVALLLLVIPAASGQIFGPKISKFIVEYTAPYTDANVAALKALGANVTAQFKLIPAVAATFSEDLVSVLRSFAYIKAIHSDKVLRIAQSPTWNIQRVRAPQVWAAGVNGTGQAVCIIDTGVDSSHAALYGRFLAQLDLVNGDTIADDENGHGTHIAGIIASSDPNVPGVAPGASIIAAKACGANGECLTSNVLLALDWCTGSAVGVGSGGVIETVPPPSPLPKVAEMALGGLTAPSVPNCDAFEILAQAANAAVGKGLTVVAAAGNLGPLGVTTPGCASKVITVGASDENDQVAAFSSQGDKVDLVAPGTNIQSLAPPSRGPPISLQQFTNMSGTSQASAHVAGAAALLFQVYQSLTPADVKKSLKDTAVRLPDAPKKAQGDGRLDAFLAFRHASFQEVVAPPKIDISAPTFVFAGDPFIVDANVRNPSSFTLFQPTLMLERASITPPLLEGRIEPLPQTLALGVNITARTDIKTQFGLTATAPGVVRLVSTLSASNPTLGSVNATSFPTDRIFILPQPVRTVFDAIAQFFGSIFGPGGPGPALQSTQLRLSQAVAALNANNTAGIIASLSNYEVALNQTADSILAVRAAGQNATAAALATNATDVVRVQTELLGEFLIRAPEAAKAAVLSAINSANRFIQTVSTVPIPGITMITAEIERTLSLASVRASMSDAIEVLFNRTRQPPLQVDDSTMREAVRILRIIKSGLFASADRIILELNVSGIRQNLSQDLLRAQAIENQTLAVASRLLNTSVDGIKADLLNAAIRMEGIIIAEVERQLIRFVTPERASLFASLFRQIERIDTIEFEKLINQTGLERAVRQTLPFLTAPPAITDENIRDFILALLRVFQTLETLKLDTLESFLDRTAPTISNLRVAPDPVRPGRNVTISFSVNESLIQNPIVLVGSENDPKMFPAAFLSSSGSLCAAPPKQTIGAVPWAMHHRISPDMSPSRLSADLDTMKQLGVKFVRFNAWWPLVEPQRDVFDLGVLDFYKSYVSLAKSKGLEPIVILGAPTPPTANSKELVLGAPPWAILIRATNSSAFFLEFEDYSKRVAAELGANVRFYQLWNEPNAPTDPVALSLEDDVEIFRAARRGIAAADTNGFETVINPAGGFSFVTSAAGSNWREATRFYLTNAPESIDIIAPTFYPGNAHFAFDSPRDWSFLNDLFSIGNEFGKKVAVMETGFSTPENVPFHFEPHGQQNWISAALPSMLEKFTVIVDTLATDLETPWAMAFAPDGRIFFTERAGRVNVLDNRTVRLVTNVTNVAAVGFSGLLGIALHPDFATNNYIYVYYTRFGADGRLYNRVSRFKEALGISSEEIILDNIPGGELDGGRIKFGPDGKLYVPTGSANNNATPQNLSNLAGKILRLNPDGSIPLDNPFPGSPVYSYGHRNPQGLAFKSDGTLYETEHGEFGNDEINLIQAGRNYGWPLHECNRPAPAGIENPVVCFGGFIFAPSGATFLNGSDLYVTGLRGQQIRKISFAADGRTVISNEKFIDGFGRLQEAIAGPDGLYVSTLNRGTPSLPPGDDRILRIRIPFIHPAFTWAGWYELYDRDSAENTDIEARFGILNTDRTPKVAVDDLKYYMNAPAPAGRTSETTSDAACTYSYRFTVPQDIVKGAGRLRAAAFASAIDRAQAALVGNEGNATATFIIDALPPKVANVSVTPPHTSGANVTVTFDTDEELLDRPNVEVRDARGVVRPAVLVSSIDAKSFSFQFDVSGLEGLSSVFILARDLAENLGFGNGTLTIDRTPPTTTSVVRGATQTAPFSEFFMNNATVILTPNDLSPIFSTLFCVDLTNTCQPASNGTTIIVDAKGKNFVRFFSRDAAGNLEDIKNIVVAIDKDSDGDGVFDNFDACPTVAGPIDRQGCPVADIDRLELHVIDQGQVKTACAGGAGSCKSPLPTVSIRVFNTNDSAFQAAWTKTPPGTQYANIYEAGIGWVNNATPLYQATGASCITGLSGTCTAGELSAGDYLVIGKFVTPDINPATGRKFIVYTGKTKLAGEFVNGVATKDFQIIRVIRRDGTVQYFGGSKTVVLGSMLEIVHPDYTIWENTNMSYPFLFTSGSNWSVEVCLQVPTGYKIVEPGNCTQTFVEKETKAILFGLNAISSPEPDVKALVKTRSPENKVTALTINIPGQRIRAAAFPMFELLLGVAAAAGLGGAAYVIRRRGGMRLILRLRSAQPEQPSQSPQLWEQDID